MKNEKVLLTVKLIVVYSILLGTTALPLLFNMLTESSVGRLLGRMLAKLIMAGVVFVFYKNKKKIFAELGYSTKNIGKQSFICFLWGLLKNLCSVVISSNSWRN
ncbi:MAG: hypothetical protein MR355_05300 [Lachnospiraceae bacterium]|nr:hypothetical protein [Lachnospiraceae bacterium]